MTLVKCQEIPLGHGQQLCEILSRSKIAVKRYAPDMNFNYVCTQTFTLEIWTWVKVMTHPWVRTAIVWNIQIQGSSKRYDSDMNFNCVYCYLDLGYMTLIQGHVTPLGHGQQLCEILSRSNTVVKRYDPDTNFNYVCTVTLTLEMWSWVQVMKLPWVLGNICVKYCPDQRQH